MDEINKENILATNPDNISYDLKAIIAGYDYLEEWKRGNHKYQNYDPYYEYGVSQEDFI